jgi:hypothetical protein
MIFFADETKLNLRRSKKVWIIYSRFSLGTRHGEEIFCINIMVLVIRIFYIMQLLLHGQDFSYFSFRSLMNFSLSLMSSKICTKKRRENVLECTSKSRIPDLIHIR